MRKLITKLKWTTVVLAMGVTFSAHAAEKPNIVLFLVDDMGWMDSEPYGSRYYETPSMDRLARRSMRFTDAYTASPLCSPTRASIITGKYPARIGFTTAAGHRPPLPPDAPLHDLSKAAPSRKTLYPQSKRFVAPGEVTIAEALKKAGYTTAHIGKWHMGLNPEHWPDRQGFDVTFHCAPDAGPPSYFSPYGVHPPGTPGVRFTGTVTDGPKGEYIVDRITDEALRFIEARKDGPFLLHLWQYGVHGPWEAKKEYIEEFAKKTDPTGRQSNPVMAAMLKSVDDSLGRVLDKLDELGIADNTIVIFYSDNGGNIHSMTEDKKRGYERILKDPNHPLHDYLVTYRKFAGYQAPTSNAPLRKGKGWIFEGGNRVPLMVCWPGITKPGSVCGEVVSSVDMYPTMLQMAGVKAPPEQQLDGLDLTPLLKGADALRREAIFCDFPHGAPAKPGGSYVRKGDWKLIRWFETSTSFPSGFELYNLRDDIGETTNLAGKHPERVKEMNALLEAHYKDTGALLPIPNPAYRKQSSGVSSPDRQGASTGPDWNGEGATKVERTAAGLRLTGTGKRTKMVTKDVPSGHSGAFLFRVRMRVEQGRSGNLYWSTKRDGGYAKERRVVFRIPEAGSWQDYSISFETPDELTGLRLDASTALTTVEIASLRLETKDGKLLKEWSFGAHE